MLKWKIFRSKWLAISWFIIISVLFFLPGSALPPATWGPMQFFEDVYFDKWVHLGFFTILVFLWRSAFDGIVNNYTALLFLTALLYGFIVELIQNKWVPNRDFDLYDILSDAIGSLLGVFLWLWVYKKNKPL